MNAKAKPEHIWICAACGKQARWRYGFDDKNVNDPERSAGWDESCVMRATLCHKDKKDGLWQAVSEEEGRYAE